MKVEFVATPEREARALEDRLGARRFGQGRAGRDWYAQYIDADLRETESQYVRAALEVWAGALYHLREEARRKALLLLCEPRF